MTAAKDLAGARKTGGKTKTLMTAFAVASAFRRDERGAFTAFSLFIFLAILLIGGMAVDLMRLEMRRTALQNTVDSAVLAAADLDQALDSEAVVRSYFEHAGFDPNDVSVVVNPTYIAAGGELVGREVRANTTVVMDTIFMDMIGINTLRTPTTGSAIENIQNVEISLVLDISGSMRFPQNNSTPSDPNADNRINDLREAVTEFVHSVLQVTCTDEVNKTGCTQSQNTDSTTINIIPYAGHVNPGPHLFAHMGGSRWHDWSSCIEVTDADFDHADLPGASGNQLPHFMEWGISNPRHWMNWGWCPDDDASIMVMENDYYRITDFVQNMKMHDGTATHVGMKYGVALLNPTSRSAVEALNAVNVQVPQEIGAPVTRKLVEDAYKARPANWDDDVVKYVVLMTDGKTTGQFRPKVDGSHWNYDAVYNTSHSDHDEYMDLYGSVDSNGSENSQSDLEFYPSTSTFNDGTKTHNESTNNGNITAMCDEAKKPVYAKDAQGNIIYDNGEPRVEKEDRITVFTIAFLAPSNAQTLMKNCASSESHYFPISDLNIGNAFQAIAKTINQLRLSQ